MQQCTEVVPFAPVAIVTSAGRGIGRAIALALAANGTAVAAISRTESQVAETAALIETAGGRGLGLVADVTERAAVERIAGIVAATLGPVDLLVNNAGSHAAIGPVWEVDPDLWWADVTSNLLGPFLCSRAVLPGMIARGHGRIINLASGAALEPRSDSSAYAAAKAAVLRFTDSLALSTRGRGISVFAIHPGGVRTALTRQIMASDAGRAAYPHWQDLDWQQPERAAALVVELASGRADVLSGCYIDVTQDDVTELVRRATEIEQHQLYSLRLQRLPPEPEL